MHQFNPLRMLNHANWSVYQLYYVDTRTTEGFKEGENGGGVSNVLFTTGQACAVSMICALLKVKPVRWLRLLMMGIDYGATCFDGKWMMEHHT
jgi:hypothetical protein